MTRLGPPSIPEPPGEPHSCIVTQSQARGPRKENALERYNPVGNLSRSRPKMMTLKPRPSAQGTGCPRRLGRDQPATQSTDLQWVPHKTHSSPAQAVQAREHSQEQRRSQEVLSQPHPLLPDPVPSFTRFMVNTNSRDAQLAGLGTLRGCQVSRWRYSMLSTTAHRILQHSH